MMHTFCHWCSTFTVVRLCNMICVVISLYFLYMCDEIIFLYPIQYFPLLLAAIIVHPAHVGPHDVGGHPSSLAVMLDAFSTAPTVLGG